MGDEWENGDIPSVTQSSACGHTAVVRMYFLLLLYISDTLASQWHGEHALPDACACKMTYHCRSGMIEFIFVILFFVVCNAKSCQRLLLVSLNYKRKLEIKCFMGIMTCSKKQRSLCKS